MLTERVKKVTGGNKGDPTRPLGEKPTKAGRIFQRRRWGPDMQAYALKTAKIQTTGREKKTRQGQRRGGTNGQTEQRETKVTS